MTTGEKIQLHRKRLGLSQEELGQKLLVSRQTVSLWEKDQNLPTIDNLIRLREIFGVSVDELLGFENAEQSNVILPNESYKFTFSKEELSEIYKLQRKRLCKKPILFALFVIPPFVFCIECSAPDLIIGFALGMLLFYAILFFKEIRAYSKAWKNSLERVGRSTYEYNLFENYISVNIYRGDEKFRETKCFFTDIEQIQLLGNWFFLQFEGQLFIIRKRDLIENSAFYSWIYKNPSKTVDIHSSKWRNTSTLLFVASLLSPLIATVLDGAISEITGLFSNNMWVFFLLTPIPISSIIFGFVLKSKGYKYKKNIIVGLIITLILCVYGSFIFIS